MAHYTLRDEEGREIRWYKRNYKENNSGRTIGFMEKAWMTGVLLLLIVLLADVVLLITAGVLPNSRISYVSNAAQHSHQGGLGKMMKNNQQGMIDLNKIAQIESSGNPNALNKKSGAIGLYQIQAALPDYNQHGPEGLMYSKEDLVNPEVNGKIASWYFNERIPQLLTAKGVPVTDNHVLMAYNWGPGNVSKWHRNGANPDLIPKETMNYLKKYYGVTK